MKKREEGRLTMQENCEIIQNGGVKVSLTELPLFPSQMVIRYLEWNIVRMHGAKLHSTSIILYVADQPTEHYNSYLCIDNPPPVLLLRKLKVS